MTTKKVGFLPLNQGEEGSDSNYGSFNMDDDEEEDPQVLDRSFSRRRSSVGALAALNALNAENVFTSVRFTADKYDVAMVPTQIENNVKLVADPNLDPREPGVLYFAEEAFYNKDFDPYYALTIHPSIYQRIFREVSDAYGVPCGLYFCCHGGDGAHTGVSHEDHVDITFAWTLVILWVSGMLILSAVMPWPSNDDDDFFERL